MLKHMEDGGELNVLLDDKGTVLLVCDKCREVWAGSVTVVQLAHATRAAKTMLQAAMADNPSVLLDMGLDAESLADLGG